MSTPVDPVAAAEAKIAAELKQRARKKKKAANEAKALALAAAMGEGASTPIQALPATAAGTSSARTRGTPDMRAQVPTIPAPVARIHDDAPPAPPKDRRKRVMTDAQKEAQALKRAKTIDPSISDDELDLEWMEGSLHDVNLAIKNPSAPVYVPKWAWTTNDDPSLDRDIAADVMRRCCFPRDKVRMGMLTTESVGVSGYQGLYQVQSLKFLSVLLFSVICANTLML